MNAPGVGADSGRPGARIEDERSGQVAGRSSHGDDLGLASRFHAHKVALLDVVGVLR